MPGNDSIPLFSFFIFLSRQKKSGEKNTSTIGKGFDSYAHTHTGPLCYPRRPSQDIMAGLPSVGGGWVLFTHRDASPCCSTQDKREKTKNVNNKGIIVRKKDDETRLLDLGERPSEENKKSEASQMAAWDVVWRRRAVNEMLG